MLAVRNSPFLRAVVLVAIGAPLALGAASLVAAQSGGSEVAARISPLRQHLVAKRAAIEAQSKQQVAPLRIHNLVTAESRSGVRRLNINGKFQALSDSERRAAGFNLGAGSWDSLIGALASAVADEYVVQAALKGIPLDSLDVEFTSKPDDPNVAKTRKVRYPRNLGYVAYIESPATDAQLEDLRKAVEKSSSAINLVVQSQPVDHLEVTYVKTPQVRDPGQPPGLREFIKEEQQPANERSAAQSAKAGGGGGGGALRAVTHVEPHTGIRNTRTGVHRFQQLHDSAPGLLGYGLAATVEEHLIGITGTCLTHIFEIQAATRNVPLDGLELTVDATLTPRFGKGITAPSRFKDIRYSVRVESPASAEEVDGLRQAVEGICPLYNLLKDEQPVEGQVVRHAYKPAS